MKKKKKIKGEIRIMNKEEIKHLNQSYYDLHKKYDNLKKENKYLDKVNCKLRKTNKQLKDNWNKLRECLKDVMNSSEADDKDFVKTILDIIQEIEESDSNVKD